MADAVVDQTTDLILACVGNAMGLAGVTDKMPVRAVVVFEALDTDGNSEINYIATKTMAATDVIGFGHFLRESATAALLGPEDDDED